MVCEFQEATLTIQVTETNSSTTDNALPETTRSYSGQPSEVSAMYRVADGLTDDTNYTVRAEVESSTGTVFAEAVFGKYGSFLIVYTVTAMHGPLLQHTIIIV